MQRFQELNLKNQLTKQPTWERIPKDLSGPEKKQVFLWFMRGEGKGVLTELQLAL